MPLKRSTPIQIIIAVILGLGLFLLIYTPIDAYIFNWQYTGFGPKTIWDWLELLIIPLALAIGGYVFNQVDKQAERERAEQQARTEREIAEQRAQDELLQTYIDQMTELLLVGKLRESQPGDEVRHVAQVRTLIALRRLDRERRTILMQFLKASQLVGIDEAQMIVDFRAVDLSRADLSGTLIGSINLKDAWLFKSKLQKAFLHRADLEDASLSEADLKGAFLEKANLRGADLTKADLTKADLRGTALTKADLTKANLRGVDFTEADLTEAIVTLEQLAQTKSLKGATMPDGSIHD